jgi:hypothetical protein
MKKLYALLPAPYKWFPSFLTRIAIERQREETLPPQQKKKGKPFPTFPF